MLAVVSGEAGFPVVLHSCASKYCQNADGSHGYLAPFGVHIVVGQQLGCGHMQPVQFASYSQTALIIMRHPRSYQLGGDSRQTGLDLGHQAGIGLQHKGFSGSVSIEVVQQLIASAQGNELIVVQVAGLHLQTGTILDCLAHIEWKSGFDLLSTLRTVRDFNLMFGHFNVRRCAPVDCHTLAVFRDDRSPPLASRLHNADNN